MLDVGLQLHFLTRLDLRGLRDNPKSERAGICRRPLLAANEDEAGKEQEKRSGGGSRTELKQARLRMGDSLLRTSWERKRAAIDFADRSPAGA